MKNRTMLIASVVALLIMAFIGCKDGVKRSSQVLPNENTEAVFVPYDALVDALWDLGDEEVNEAARCLATSTFTFEPANGFTIQLSDSHTPENISDVIVVSGLNIQMLDSNADARGEECPEGELRYIVSASQIAPIDVEASEEFSNRRALKEIAGAEPTPFPTTCKVTAHFEKQEGERYVLVPSADDEIVANDEELTDETPEDQAASDEGVEEASENTGDGESVGEETEDTQDNSDETAESDVTIETVPSLKLVLDKYDCTANPARFHRPVL